MKNYYLKKTSETPEVDFNINGNLKMNGKSYPENSFLFYDPIINWLITYHEDINEEIKFDINLTYFNSSSSIQICNLFDILSNHSSKVKINWIYDYRNESSLEAGQDFIDEFKELDIELLSIS
jgi:hypothetical protein